MRFFFAGEMLMRLECVENERFADAGKFKVRYTGAEFNSAVAMSMFGSTGLFLLSAFSDDALGKACRNYVRRFGVSTEHSCVKAGRLGKFFFEKGFGLRPSQVIYDRSDSVFANAGADDFRLDGLFQRGDHLHVSGTVFAVNLPLAGELLERARTAGASVSLDLNYRATLWEKEQDAARAFTAAMKYVDILIANASVAETLLGTAEENLCRTFGFRCAVLTERGEEAADINTFSARVHSADGKCRRSRSYRTGMLDRVGGGDAFAGGFLHEYLDRKEDLEQALQFAVGACIVKQTVDGDLCLAEKDEVWDFIHEKQRSVRR